MLRACSIAGALTFIDQTWRRFALLEKLFAAAVRQVGILDLVIDIAIFTTCLGLFGLAAFRADRRGWEIGVRKLFDTPTGNVMWLVLCQFSIPVLIVNMVAWTIALYYLHDWFDGYVYRVTSGASALMTTWTAVIDHDLAIARANLICALRYG